MASSPAFAIDVAPETLDCEEFTESGPPDRPETAEERTTRLQMEFERSLRHFDRCISKVTQDENGAAGGAGGSTGGPTGSGGSGGAQASSEGGEGEGGESAAEAAATASASSGAQGDGDPELGQSESAKHSATGAQSGSVPHDIPRGDDDDIVAQQLRQAAMETTDPEAREKLWDEYRKYKGI